MYTISIWKLQSAASLVYMASSGDLIVSCVKYDLHVFTTCNHACTCILSSQSRLFKGIDYNYLWQHNGVIVCCSLLALILWHYHYNKSKISCTLRLRKCVGNTTLQSKISGSLHEIRLCHVHLMHISWCRKFNFFCSVYNMMMLSC